jgi:DNA helicase-2/ATP-dependent DNA helicase PcrA
MEDGVFPHSRSIEEDGLEEERRLFYVGVTRARELLTLTHASARSLWGKRDYSTASRFLDELGSGIDRDRLSPASWSGYGNQAASIEPQAEVPTLSTGDNVAHETLGEGIVTRVEPGGVVTVRFGDGAERRLILEYAPLRRL